MLDSQRAVRIGGDACGHNARRSGSAPRTFERERSKRSAAGIALLRARLRLTPRWRRRPVGTEENIAMAHHRFTFLCAAALCAGGCGSGDDSGGGGAPATSSSTSHSSSSSGGQGGAGGSGGDATTSVVVN